MPLSTSLSEIEGITIISLDGRLVFGPEASGAQDLITATVSGGQNRLVLDLEKTSFIDSTGLGVLVVAHSMLEKANGTIKLLHLSKRHVDLLVLTKLTTIFELFDDLQAAIDSFFPDRAVKHFDILEFVKSQGSESDEAEDHTAKPEADSKA